MKVHKDDNGRAYYDIQVVHSFGEETMANFMKLSHKLKYPRKDPSEWKKDELLFALKQELRFHGRSRIDKVQMNPTQIALYYRWAYEYFPELKR